MANDKKTYRTDIEKKNITNRINRMAGQLNGVRKMVENDSDCNDILTQLSAIESSVRSLSNHILENHLYKCVSNDLEAGGSEVINELVGIFKKFNR